MKCPSCGRNVEPGQVFCPCGSQVADLNGGAPAPDLTAKRSDPPVVLFVILALAGLVFMGLLIGGGYALLFQPANNIKNKDTYEHITRSSYSITIPRGMKNDNTQILTVPGAQLLDTFHSSEAAILVATMPLGSDLSKLPRKKLLEMLKKYAPADDGNGHEVVLQEHGNMIYYEVIYDDEQVFPGSSGTQMIGAYYVSGSNMFIVCTFCDPEKYEEYKPYIFSWYDSFKAN